MMANILIVDDEEPIRRLIGEILGISNYECALAGSAAEASKLLQERHFELILCDIDMPESSGLDFIRHALREYPDTAAVMVTALDDSMTAEVALESGAYDYIIKPFDRNRLLISVANALRRRQLEIDNRAHRESLELEVQKRAEQLMKEEARLRAIFEAAEHVSFVMIDNDGTEPRVLEFSPGAERMLGFSADEVIGQPASMLNLPKDVVEFQPNGAGSHDSDLGFTGELTLTRRSGEKLPVLFTTYPIHDAKGNVSATLLVSIDISERMKAEEELQNSMRKWRKALEGSIHAMALTVEIRDAYTAGHQQRVVDLATAVAQEMGLSEDEVAGLRMAAMIHDIGKVSVPAEILSKPGRINEIEFDLIRMHPKVGYDILKSIEFPWPIARIVLQHHERMDGSGYPAGLAGPEILLEAKILGVADVVEAMASHRPYRPALGLYEALEEISKNKGILYDSEVVSACLKVFEEGGFTFDY
jgi:PAS domain S-box-containing protein/putative nucleotidyltransferase with HDIG domain